MRIASFNVNGIRASVRRGFDTWLRDRAPDIVLLQEVRCPAGLLPTGVWDGYHLAYDEGSRAGRNGVAILSRQAPTDVRAGMGSREFDGEGRYLETDLPGLTVASLYLPKGDVPTGDDAAIARYERKLRFMSSLRTHLTRSRRRAAAAGREFLVAGDFNIAHETIDLKNWRTNQKNAGFLPDERAWFATILGPRTLHDVVRRLHPGVPGPYSWWSWRGQAWTTDAGWRIDYQLATPGLSARATTGATDREPTYEARMSDHSPVVVDYAD
ncbi:exodeoxyribonuclease III [Propionicicella superfundia]|uniref:exodeoxyribonuclease III n=1 Tax=Propionicicella superfundia TaxID=348582 RepID=UPI00041A10F5|nr:exodeoxyribonuclease III [Propionicicella superfundia]